MHVLTLDNIIDFSNDISKGIDQIYDNLPYHLNIIDELHANENAHSRIFAKILQYKEYGRYPFLELFYDQLDLGLTLENPKITVEKDRIDILIIDNSYSIIIENKINYAVDQESQIVNYVNKVKRKTNIENIYVLYLTRQGIKKPNARSLTQKLRIQLGKRYKEVNYRNNILPWLEELLPLCRVKDVILVAAIQQYIDFLKGLLSIRENQYKMNIKLENIIKSKLELNETINAKDDRIILEKLNQFEKISKILQSMHIKYRDGLRKCILKQLYEKLNQRNLKWSCRKYVSEAATIEEANAKNFGFAYERRVNIDNEEVFLSVEIQDWNKFLCGVFTNDNNLLKDKIIDIFKTNKLEVQSTKYWVYLHLDEYNYKGNKIAWSVYDDRWNELYETERGGIVDTYYRQIEKVSNIWDKVE